MPANNKLLTGALDEILRYGLQMPTFPAPEHPWLKIPELYEILQTAERLRCEKGHPTETLGPSIAIVLREILLAYLKQTAPLLSPKKLIHQYQAAIIIVEQYLIPLDGQRSMEEVLHRLGKPAYLKQQWGFDDDLAEQLRLASLQMSSSTYYRHRAAGVKLLAEALQYRAVDPQPSGNLLQNSSAHQPGADAGKRAALPPRQAPVLSSFYVERVQLQQQILDRINREANRGLVLFGPGGAGKTSLAIRVARYLAPLVPDGVIWGFGDTVVEIQASIARSFQVTLGSQSPAERAGELRTLLRDKHCLLILDDLWAGPDLPHLQVVNEQSYLLLTTRDTKVADALNCPAVRVGGLTIEEGQALLAAWTEREVEAQELVRRLGGLPLALSLSAAQLRWGHLTLVELLAHFQASQADLSLLDLDDPQTRSESLTVCFDLSYQRLNSIEQQRFAQLCCFAGQFEPVTAGAIWGVDAATASRTLRRLQRFAMVECSEQGYHLHALLKDYARQKLSIWPDLQQCTYKRHAAWYIRYALYHPKVVEGATEPPPSLEHSWSDVTAGVKWTTEYAPELAAIAILLAHTERPALLEAVGPGLITAIEQYIPTLSCQTEQALFLELLGDLYLLIDDFVTGLSRFLQASDRWAAEGNWLDSSRAQVRAAGAYLLSLNVAAAAEVAREAQVHLARGLPLNPDDQPVAKWLFYWFDVLYNALVRWPDLPEADAANLARLGEQSQQPLLMARGLHVYRLWCTVENIPRSAESRVLGRELALRAYHLWRACDRLDQADDEVSFAQYQLDRRYSRLAAARYARRRSRSTPSVNAAQISLAKSAAVRWWLGATETQRVAWFSRMLPRYQGACNYPKPALIAGSRAWCWIKDILSVSVLGGEGRILMKSGRLPVDHFLNEPEWLALSGRRIRPLTGITPVGIISCWLAKLELTEILQRKS